MASKKPAARRPASKQAFARRPSANDAPAEPKAKAKRSPLRHITAKKVKPPKDVPVGPKQIRFLRGLGHSLDPVVQVGKAGITEEVIAQTRVQLGIHELIKVKVSEEDREVRKALAEQLATGAQAVLAQILGRTLLLYKRHPKNPKIALPRTPSKDDAEA